MKLLSVILLCLFSVSAFCGEAVLVIKGKSARKSLKIMRQPKGTVCKRSNATVELGVRTQKNFQRTSVNFKVLRDDEFSFSFGGGYIRYVSGRKNKFDWVDCALLKVNDVELIGPNAGKEAAGAGAPEGAKGAKAVKGAKGAKGVKPGVKAGSGKEAAKFTTCGSQKALKGSVKVRKGDTLKIEMIVRATARDEAKRRDSEGSMTERQKARMKKEAEKEKLRAAEREKAEKERQAVAARNREVLEKRYGVKNADRTAGKAADGKQTAAAEPASASGEETEPGSGDDGE